MTQEVNVKQHTINKVLNMLNEAKYLTDHNKNINVRELGAKHDTTGTFLTAAVELGYFSGSYGRYQCYVAHFEPKDARKIIQNYYKRKTGDANVKEQPKPATHMTDKQLLDELRHRGYRFDNIWKKVDL